jgi:hypothetical protein
MPTQPARPKSKAKTENDQNLKKWAIIGFGSVAVFVAGFFALNALMTEKRGGDRLVNAPVADSQPVKKFYVDDTPVALAPRPIRLYEEYIKAIQRNDRKVVLKYSEVDEAKMDLLMTEERVKILTEALTAKRWRYTDKVIEGDKANMAAIFQNGKGFDVMELRLVMRLRGGAEDWVVTRIEDRWFATSGKMPESRTIELGGDRTVAAAPLKIENTFSSMPEAEPKVLDWLPGTGEAQKAEIERHIRDLFDEKNPAKLSNASQSLTTIGKPAIPKILSEFVGLDIAKNEADIKKGNALDRTLAVMTDLEMGYDPATFQSAGALPPAAGRLRALRRWFGWWEKNKDHPLTRRPAEEK